MTDMAAETSPAPLAPRIIAAFIDYLLIQALFFLTQQFLPGEKGSLVSLLWGALYFSAGNSRLCGGRTLGKRIFGLRVVQRSSGELLSFTRSFVRFLFAFGLLQILAELPSQYYRARGVVAPVYLLELNMLLALCYFAGNALTVLLTPRHLGLHDRAAGSIVTRDGEEKVPYSTRSDGPALALALTLGMLLGGALWWLGLPKTEAASRAASYRYLIERDFAVRILAMHGTNDLLEIEIVFPEPGALPDRQFAEELVLSLKEKGAFASGQRLKLTFYRQEQTGDRMTTGTVSYEFEGEETSK